MFCWPIYLLSPVASIHSKVMLFVRRLMSLCWSTPTSWRSLAEGNERLLKLMKCSWHWGIRGEADRVQPRLMKYSCRGWGADEADKWSLKMTMVIWVWLWWMESYGRENQKLRVMKVDGLNLSLWCPEVTCVQCMHAEDLSNRNTNNVLGIANVNQLVIRICICIMPAVVVLC